MVVCVVTVSGPSRGTGGFLHYIEREVITMKLFVSVPSRGMGGFLLKDFYGQSKSDRFPSPLEVWVVSYSRGYHRMSSEDYCFRPLSRYGWFPTQAKVGTKYDTTDHKFPSPLEVWVVSYNIHSYHKLMDTLKFPSPLEVWVVSYPISCTPKGNQHTR